MRIELIVEIFSELKIQSANGRYGWTSVAMLSSNRRRKLSNVAFGGMRLWLMRVFAGLSAALATHAIGKKAYKITNPRSRSLNAMLTPRRGDTACAVSEVLTDLL